MSAPSFLPLGHSFHAQIDRNADYVLGSSFKDPTALMSGTVVMGKNVYVGPFARVETKGDYQVILSREDNVQDLVLISATTRSVVVGVRTSIAHGAQVLNSTVGNFVFIGFNAYIEDAVLEDGAMVLHGARVKGVTIPKDCIVSPGAVITCAAQMKNLLCVTEANHEFKEEVIAVNIELASGYRQMQMGSTTGVQWMGPNPKTSWNAEPSYPLLGKDVIVSQDARIIGFVRLGEGSYVGKMTSIRGDEGTPIGIGNGARIGGRVTFHALKGQIIEIGSQLNAGDGAVLHGALTLGDQVTVGEHAVLFKSRIGSHCSIGKNALVIGVTLAENSQIPDGTLVLNQTDADRYAPEDALSV